MTDSTSKYSNKIEDARHIHTTDILFQIKDNYIIFYYKMRIIEIPLHQGAVQHDAEYVHHLVNNIPQLDSVSLSVHLS